jgi:hypothetical protein
MSVLLTISLNKFKTEFSIITAIDSYLSAVKSC